MTIARATCCQWVKVLAGCAPARAGFAPDKGKDGHSVRARPSRDVLTLRL
jgi:hypothetical protein